MSSSNAPQPSPTPSPPNPVRQLLDAADRALAFAEAQYGDTRRLAGEEDAATARAIFEEQQRIRGRLIEAGNDVVARDYGPRATQEDVMRRVRDVWEVVARLLAWGFRNRGRKPAPWPATAEEAADLGAVPPWAGDARVVRAETERGELRQELRAASQRLELLLTLGANEPRQGPVPPDKFKWGGAEATDLPPAQYQLLGVLWSAGPPGTTTSIGAVTQALYETASPDEKTKRALEQLRRRTQRQGLDAYGVRLRVGMGNGELWLEPLGDD
jgi:hypothetical protein